MRCEKKSCKKLRTGHPCEIEKFLFTLRPLLTAFHEIDMQVSKWEEKLLK